MSYNHSTIMTLDAGGTNFVFSAIREYKEVINPIHILAHPKDLDLTLQMIISGFEQVVDHLSESPAAISFAFPGPANYAAGIIGDLPNFSAFRGGVPLGPMLEHHFGIPVFINNDGNLFAYGEALVGFLPELNNKLERNGSLVRYKNLIGLTLGTGFGAGIVLNKMMLVGDNSCAAEVHNTLNPWNTDWNAEESISTRAIQRVYAAEMGLNEIPALMPLDIYKIATGASDSGNREAAIASFEKLGRSLGSAIVNILALIDGIIVIGGGLSAAWDLFSGSMFKEIDRNYLNNNNEKLMRLSYKVYDLNDDSVFPEFAKGHVRMADVLGSDKQIPVDMLPRTGIGTSKLGTNKAIAFGAYAFAMQQLHS